MALIEDKWEQIEEKRDPVQLRMPVGDFGSQVARDLNENIEFFLDPLLAMQVKQSEIEIDLKIDRLRLTGTLLNATPDLFLKFRYAKLKPKDLLMAWVEHLVLCSSVGNGAARTMLVGKSQTAQFPFVANARETLLYLEEIFLKGIQSPQPLFSQASYAYAKAVWQGITPAKDCWKKARKEFIKKRNPQYHVFDDGDGFEPHIRLCFPEVEMALGGEFRSIAKTVYGKMLERLKMVKGSLP